MSEQIGPTTFPVPTITRVAVRNYRSIAECDVELGPLTLLVGENGAGKSNFLDALRFVAETTQEPLEQLIRRRGGMESLVRRGGEPAEDFSIDLTLSLSDCSTGRYGFTISKASFSSFELEEEHGGLVAVECVGTPPPAQTTLTTIPTRRDRLSLPLVTEQPDLRLIYEALSRLAFYHPSPDAIRGTQPPSPGRSLAPTGDNLAAVVERLRRDQSGALGRIEQYLTVVVPSIREIGVESLGSGTAGGGLQTPAFLHGTRDGSAGLRFLAAAESDGTLRAVAILTALLQAGPQTPVLVGIEEPEAALHPGAVGVLIDAMREATLTRQVLVTTHSADVLDHPSIMADELRTVSMVDGQTVIGPVDDVARDMLRRRLFGAGELLRMDQLNARSVVR